ncbi:hypothetical protein [Pedobacter sp. JY14-1]|uniref:hypothetical protein n=1 Tax=Pedobacter sp. JY14-1 TaxID=3034151 RepID=UPI0023E16945|nr:hypothetical protein [Pedobacter sp. JY14-1]
MNYKLGDFVRFVDENLEGYITRIIDKDTIGVTDSNDFEIPVLASKVTLIHGDVQIEEVRAKASAAPQLDKPFTKEGIFLAVVTDQHNSSVAHFHLLNESSFQLLASFSTEKGSNFKGEFAGDIQAGSSRKIYTTRLSDIQVWPEFRLEIIFHTPLSIQPPPPLIFHRQLKGKDLSVAKTNIALLEQKGWLIRLDEPTPLIDAEKLKNSFFK